MKKFAWITDSACGLSEEYLKENNIHVIPLHVILDHVAYRENIDLTSDQFYERLKEEEVDAKTSQPSYGEFIQLFNQLKEEYECGIAIHASSELTGTYESSISASKQTGFPIEAIDSKIGAYALGKMIQKGIALEKEGASYEEIVTKLRKYTKQTEMYLLPASFKQLKRSGRVSTPQAIFASLLNINIILGFDDGKVIVVEKSRTKKRAKGKLFEKIQQAIDQHKIEEVCVMHAGVFHKAQEWKEELQNLHEQLKVKIETLVPVAGVHTGYGTMAVSWLFD